MTPQRLRLLPQSEDRSMKKAPRTRRAKTGRSPEVAALLAAARAVLVHRDFAEAAREILLRCKTIVGADAGLLALFAAGSKELEVALLDPGGLELKTDSGLPAPLRQLSARAAKGRSVIANDLAKRGAKRPAAGKRDTPESALLAPIVVGGDMAGLLGLIDKPGGFSPTDSHLAEVFAEMTAVAMLISRTVGGLEEHRSTLEGAVREGATQLRQAERKFRTLVENLPDIIARFDSTLRFRYLSPGIEKVTGQAVQHYLGKTSLQVGMPDDVAEAWDTALRRVFASGQPEVLELSYPGVEGMRHFDCRMVPERGPKGKVATVLTVARDVTARWLALQGEQKARAVADALREATVALTRSLDRETVLTTLLDRLRGMVPFDRATVMVLEGASVVSVRATFDGDRVVALAPDTRSQFDPADYPILQGILTSGKAVLVPDIAAQPDWRLPTEHSSEASWLGVPLFARGAVAGLFSLSKHEAGFFNDEHVRLAEAMSSQASVAVENAILFEQMQASTERMQLLSRRLVDAQESERRNIARELHDEAGQALTSLRYGLRLLEREIDSGGDIGSRVTELVERTDEVIDGLHRLAVDLRPASLDHLGLAAALRHFSKAAAARFGLDIHYRMLGFDGQRLPAAVETALYRVAQEAITNVVRHAHATRVDMLVEHRGDRVQLMVEDDGIGFKYGHAPARGHLGLLGLRERAEALGGTLTIESAPGKGTTVVVEVSSADPHPAG